MKRILALLLVLSLLPVSALAGQTDPAEEQENESIQIDSCMVGHSTARSGGVNIWVPKAYSDVDDSHWFFAQLQGYRLMGILQGDEAGAAHLDRIASAAEVYALFVRYVYADSYAGQTVGGTIYGDYTFQGHAAWLNAYDTAADTLQDTLDKVGKRVRLPDPKDRGLTRSDYFVLYAMAALHKAQDPAWFLGQFSDEQLGHYARSGQPIRTYASNIDVTTYFTAASILDDAAMMTPLEVQCANLLMYLGVLEGTEQHTLAPNGLLDRASAVKLLTTMDLMDTEPHHEEDREDQEPEDDWGTVDPTPTPTPTPPEPDLEHHLVPILFADLDSNIVGSLPVMTNTDIREQLNDYVKNNLVHPDLRDGDPNDTSRENTYRKDNAYTCTRYLDYAMIRTPIVKSGSRYVVQEDDTKYQWSYGWAVGDLTNYKSTWSVLGVAELEGWDGTSFPANALQVLDPEKGVQDSIVIKPIMRPGPLMYYGTEEEPANYRFIAASRWFYDNYLNEKKAEENALLIDHSALDRGDVSDQYGNWMDYLPDDSTPSWYTKSEGTESEGSLVDMTGTDLLTAALSPVESEWKPRFERKVSGMQVLTFERSHAMPDGSIRGVPYARDLVGDVIYYFDMSENFNDLQGLYGHDSATNWIAFDNRSYFAHDKAVVNKGGDTIAVSFHAVSCLHYCVLTLKDQYQSNFVSGQIRADPWRTINNFNYDMPSKNTLHPAVELVADAAGTYGFFTDIGISYWLEEYGENSRWIFSFITTEDLNLDTPLMHEKYGDSVRIHDDLFDMLGDLIHCIYTHGHDGSDEFWDPWLDRPRIDYHQLQLYIYDWEKWKYAGGPQPHVKSKTEADATIIPHCKLHFACQNSTE